MSDVDRGAVDTYALNFGEPLHAIAAAKREARGNNNTTTANPASVPALATGTQTMNATTTSAQEDARNDVDTHELILGDISE